MSQKPQHLIGLKDLDMARQLMEIPSAATEVDTEVDMELEITALKSILGVSCWEHLSESVLYWSSQRSSVSFRDMADTTEVSGNNEMKFRL